MHNGLTEITDLPQVYDRRLLPRRVLVDPVPLDGRKFDQRRYGVDSEVERMISNGLVPVPVPMEQGVVVRQGTTQGVKGFDGVLVLDGREVADGQTNWVVERVPLAVDLERLAYLIEHNQVGGGPEPALRPLVGLDAALTVSVSSTAGIAEDGDEARLVLHAAD